MSIAGLISEEYDHFLLEAQMKKATRLVLKPLVAELSKTEKAIDPEKLSDALETYLGELQELPAAEEWWDGFKAAVDGLLARLPRSYRSSLKEFSEPENDKLKGDPRFSEKAFLHYVAAQFVEKALLNRAMVCVAQNGPNFAVVSFRDFDSEDDGEFSLPAPLDPFPVQKFTEHWCEELGADRLWFAISDAMEPSLRAYSGSDMFSSPETTEPVSNSVSPRSLAEEDAPFVERARRALESGEAENSNQAIDMLEEKLWREVAPEAKSFEEAVAGGGARESKRARLYKRLREALANSP